MTSDESDDLELRVLYFIAESVMPEIDDWSAVALDGRVRGITFYGALGTLIVNAVQRNESLEGVLRTIGAIVEYAAAAVENDFNRWAPCLNEFFEALTESPAANTLFSRFASERIRAGAARIGYAWEPDG
jgi:hypothetical protein